MRGHTGSISEVQCGGCGDHGRESDREGGRKGGRDGGRHRETAGPETQRERCQGPGRHKRNRQDATERSGRKIISGAESDWTLKSGGKGSEDKRQSRRQQQRERTSEQCSHGGQGQKEKQQVGQKDQHKQSKAGVQETARGPRETATATAGGLGRSQDTGGQAGLPWHRDATWKVGVQEGRWAHTQAPGLPCPQAPSSSAAAEPPHLGSLKQHASIVLQVWAQKPEVCLTGAQTGRQGPPSPWRPLPAFLGF